MFYKKFNILRNIEYFLKVFILSIFINSCLNISLHSKDIEKSLEIKSFIKGINLANAEGIILIKNNNYIISIKANTVGIFSIFSNWQQQASSEGKFEEFKLVSKKYYSKDSRGNKKGHINLDFSGDTPYLLSAQPDPYKDNKREKIKPNNLINVLDPIAGIMNLGLKNECKKKSAVFDGKRKYEIIASKMGTEIIDKYNFFDNKIETVKCYFKIKKIAGYTKKEINKFPKEGYIWFTKLKYTNLYFPVKLKIDSNWGAFICLIKESENKKYESNYL
tara:strand:- start:19 stop:846 length:828 start_codon:yes stop_codon:yes gene_type:complete